jgi:hypothetical protein
MKQILIVLIILTVSFLYGIETVQLIQSPTAGILQKGEASMKMELYKNDGLILGARVGLFPGFMFGVSYGAEGIVGNQKPNWHSRVEFMAKYRVFDETKSIPAIAVGFSSEGHGVYYKELKRYDIKSKGFYAVASKNWIFFGNLGTHFGTNFSLENQDSKNMDFFVGLDKTIGDRITLLGEYDFAINDKNDSLSSEQENNQQIDLKKIGYLNAAIVIDFNENLSAKLSFYDLLQNRTDTKFADRTLQLVYSMKF